MSSENQQIEVQHVPAQQRFEARLQSEIAYLSYTMQGDVISLDHTYVPEALRGRGVAAELVRAALSEARQRHWKVRPRCSYVVTFFERHPEVADLADAQRS